MTDKTQVSGFAFYCDADAIIQEVIKDQLGVFENDQPLHSLFDLFSDSDQPKVKRFVEAIREDRAAIDWEINVEKGSEILPLHFSGAFIDDKLLVVGSTNQEQTVSYMEELMKMNNQQVNDIRRQIKKETAGKKSQSHELYEELTRLNNDLANAQRSIEKKNAELERLNKMKDEFIGMAAHDLRNPLGAIQSLSELLLDESFSDPLTDEQKEYVERIYESSQFMLRLVEDMLEVNKIESGKLNLDFEKIDIEELIKKNLSFNTKLAEKKDIKLSLEIESPLDNIELDSSKIEQVLNNLISNAVKYSYSNSTIMIRAYQKEERIYIEVEDEGQGIPEEEQNQLFEPFQTTSAKATGDEKSTGLGLNITKKIVEGHGGQIWVESEVDAGSVFYVELPVKQESS